MGQTEIRVSVLLSTRNRCDKLRLFLDAMKSNGSAGLTPTEVLVIDNGSSDSTKEVVAEYTSLENPVFRYLLETKPGKSRALNMAIGEAKGEIIAFTDDDCIPAPDWVESIVKEFDSGGELSVLGGRIELYDERDVQQATLLSKDRTLVTNGWEICTFPAIIGANMAFRKTALKAISGFDPLLGPGTICKAVEDLDVIYRSLKKGFKIVYSPDVMVFHNHGRRTEFDENQTTFAYGLGRGSFYLKNLQRFDFHIARIACKEVYDLCKTLTKNVITRTKSPYHRLTLPALFLGAIYYCQSQLSWE
jgi:GT2 family glycosyltransferase